MFIFSSGLLSSDSRAACTKSGFEGRYKLICGWRPVGPVTTTFWRVLVLPVFVYDQSSSCGVAASRRQSEAVLELPHLPSIFTILAKICSSREKSPYFISLIRIFSRILCL
ncbi:hypothetical protein B0H12DRAFT_1154799 [Mycena haematopus]|nr:hypothetical protein B0H12DRAFT_1225258 [Mycena haematopus]KAJ7215216.1 hypothetical protein B0H12DRAFT_1154799 [Mycena haematopus]